MKYFFMTVFFLITGTTLADVTVKAIGLQIVEDGYRGNGQGENDELRAFYLSRGVNVALLLKTAEKSLIRIDEKTSKITTFQDDKGTDFMKAKGQFSNQPYRFDRAQLSEDGKALLTTISTPGLPERGAREITLEGELMVTLASESELRKSDPLLVKQGEIFTIGERDFKISKVGKPSWGDDPIEIELKSKFDHKLFKDIKFFDEQGEEISSEIKGTSSIGFLGKRTHTVTLSLKKKTKNLILALDVWSDSEEAKIPLSLKIGAGL